MTALKILHLVWFSVILLCKKITTPRPLMLQSTTSSRIGWYATHIVGSRDFDSSKLLPSARDRKEIKIYTSLYLELNVGENSGNLLC